jgi:4-amino-4-deoxy-L-arabinose transferase-like glycosyltransferase
MKHSNEAASNTQSMHGGAFLMRISRHHILLLILITVLARFRLPFDLEGVMIGWRPPENASIALNYYLNGFHFLYPQIFWGGNGPGYVEMEFPLLQFVTGALYSVFGVHDELGVLLPFLSTIGTVIVVYLLAKYTFNAAVGFVAGFFIAISPTLIGYSSTFNVDPLMLFFSVLGLYAFIRWTENDQWSYFFVAAISTSLAVLLKPTALYIGIVQLFLCIKKYRGAFLRVAKVWLFAVLTLLPPVLWYYHAWLLSQQYHNTFGILSGGPLKLGTPQLLMWPPFYTQTAARVAVYLLSPCVFVFFLYGLVRIRESKWTEMLYVWFASLLFYLLVVGVGVLTGFTYLLPVIPLGAIFASVGVFSFISRYGAKLHFARVVERGPFWAASGICLFLLNAIVLTSLFSNRAFDFSRKYWLKQRQSALVISKVTKPSTLIITADSDQNGVPLGQIMTPPNIFYFSGHRGWYVPFSRLTQDVIESLRAKGARYFVVSAFYSPIFKQENRLTYDSLTTRYRTIMDNDDGLVLDLSQEKNLINGQGL